MKIHDVAEGSEQWLRLRLGIPTASNFHKIVTPTGKLSTQARSYMYQLIAERLLREPVEDIGNLYYVARGRELEPQAIHAYEFERDIETKPCGFITTDNGRIGCTPDRLIVGQSAAVELKCPAPHTHICYLIEGFGTDYVPQVQGQMLVGEFGWIDRYSYHPNLPPVLVRTHRDEPFITKLREALDQFCAAFDRTLETVKARGYFEDRERIKPVHRGPGLEAAFGLPPLPPKSEGEAAA